MCANAYNFLSLAQGLQNVAYLGQEFNKHAASLYASGTVQHVTLQDLNMKSSNWNPDAKLPVQEPRVLKKIFNNTSKEIANVDAATLFHNSQVKAPFMKIQHYVAPDVIDDAPLK
eukprot:3590119-Karenia_brevis.AAC.1